ncbi:cysteine desulfurase [Lentilactobacillus kosonis]|uniref:Cysteine desulfurase n=2 Tax=Lentilactobacillus TaxID=2767893 RepID=A0A401FN13_9LACO|nr:cysteine desulfurase [Lentilactobacillus kosonis]
MNVPESISTSAVRISLGDQNTVAEADEFIKVFDELYTEFDKLS